MNEGTRMVLISLVMDVTERAQAGRAVQVLQDKLREQATRDSLTGCCAQRSVHSQERRPQSRLRRSHVTGRALPEPRASDTT